LSPQLLIREITATVQRTWNIVLIVSKYKNAAAKVRLLPDMAKYFFSSPKMLPTAYLLLGRERGKRGVRVA
jgi:hypothetical protein